MKQTEFMAFAKKTEHNINDTHTAYHHNHASLSLETRDGTKKSLLDYAARLENLPLIIWLALNGIAINSQNESGKAPIHHAMEKKRIRAAVLLLLLGADTSLRTSTATKHTALTVPRYTVDKDHIAHIGLVSSLNAETALLLADPAPKLSKYPKWSEHAPLLVGGIHEIATATKHADLTKFYAAHPLLHALSNAINHDEMATKIVMDVVVYSPPEKIVPSTGRHISIHYRLSPGLAIYSGIRKLLHTGIGAEMRIRCLKGEILYHAQLRTQLAFYLFAAYYNTRIQLKLADTRAQEGQGEAAINTTACHSALISDVIEGFRWKEGVSVEKDTRESRTNSTALTKAHLHANLVFRNILKMSTVELPSAVNQYDRELEGNTSLEGAKPARKMLFELLQKVSLGSLNPIQALEMFLVELIRKDGLLDKIRLSGYLKEGCSTSPQSARPIIHRYIFTAALLLLKKMSDDSLHLRRNCVATLLFMNKEDRGFISDCSEEAMAGKCEPYFTKLQSEICSNLIPKHMMSV